MNQFFEHVTLKGVPGLCLLLAVGAVLGLAAQAVGAPLPFMLGGLFAGLLVVPALNRVGLAHMFPRPLRGFFVAVIGVLIGATFTPDLLSVLPSLPLTLAAMTVFVPCAHAVGYVVCRRVGGYDHQTALFCAMPGGLIEGIAFGQEVGGDVRALTLHHFARVISVAVLVPILFFVWKGEAVGSAVGQSLAGKNDGLDVAVVVLIAAIGLLLGRVLKLPAGQLLGAMVLAAAVQASGIWQLGAPNWLLNVAQLIVGAGLAYQMGGASLRMAGRVVMTSLTMVIVVLGFTVAVAILLAGRTSMGVEPLILSFSPGGVAEMGLIALSLQISPVIVVAHHTYRIVLTVLVASVLRRQLLRNVA
ncbi:MAG: AbrB family transcriptional regulator [Pseudomonadota bacterium]